MRVNRRSFPVLALSAGLLWSTASVTAWADSVVLRIAHVMPTAHSWHQWVLDFQDELEARVPGRVDVRVFPSAQLGSETEYLEGIKLGTISGAVMGRHGQIDPRLEVLNLPMIYRDDEHVDIVLRSGSPLNDRLDAIMYENGYKVLGWGELGFRHVTTRGKAVRQASDLQGIDIRVPNVEPWLIAFRAWGANPTPMDFSELYSALQQGVIDAQENPPEIIYTSRFYEVQDHLNLTGHANIPAQFVLGTQVWESLPADLQEAVMEAATASRDRQVASTRAANARLVADLKASGMTVISDVDKESFAAGALEAYAQFEDRIGKDLIEAVRDAR